MKLFLKILLLIFIMFITVGEVHSITVVTILQKKTSYSFIQKSQLNIVLEQFGKEVGANVWTKETETIFTKMYDLPDSWSFERSMTSVFNETVGTNQGKILFDITGVEIPKSVSGGLIHTPELVLKGNVTELELQMVLRNKSWYDNVIFHESGKVLNNQEIISKGLKYLGQ